MTCIFSSKCSRIEPPCLSSVGGKSLPYSRKGSHHVNISLQLVNKHENPCVISSEDLLKSPEKRRSFAEETHENPLAKLLVIYDAGTPKRNPLCCAGGLPTRRQPTGREISLVGQ